MFRCNCWIHRSHWIDRHLVFQWGSQKKAICSLISSAPKVSKLSNHKGKETPCPCSASLWKHRSYLFRRVFPFQLNSSVLLREDKGPSLIYFILKLPHSTPSSPKHRSCCKLTCRWIWVETRGLETCTISLLTSVILSQSKS